MDFDKLLIKRTSEIKYEAFYCLEIQLQRLTAHKLSWVGLGWVGLWRRVCACGWDGGGKRISLLLIMYDICKVILNIFCCKANLRGYDTMVQHIWIFAWSIYLSLNQDIFFWSKLWKLRHWTNGITFISGCQLNYLFIRWSAS